MLKTGIDAGRLRFSIECSVPSTAVFSSGFKKQFSPSAKYLHLEPAYLLRQELPWEKVIIFAITVGRKRLPEALQEEYKRLLKSGIPIKVKAIKDNGEEKKINNPEFVTALRDFVERFKKENK